MRAPETGLRPGRLRGARPRLGVVAVAAVLGLLVVTGCSTTPTAEEDPTDSPSAPGADASPEQPGGQTSASPTPSDSQSALPRGNAEFIQHLRQQMEPLGVTDLNEQEHGFRDARLFGHWPERDLNVYVNYYKERSRGEASDNPHSQQSPVTVAGVRGVRSTGGFPAGLTLSFRCADGFYDVSVFPQGVDEGGWEAQPGPTRDLAAAMVEEFDCRDL